MSATRSAGWRSEAGEGSAGNDFDDEVVDGYVEGFGEADEGVGAGGDAFGCVMADALAVGAYAFAEPCFVALFAVPNSVSRSIGNSPTRGSWGENQADKTPWAME